MTRGKGAGAGWGSKHPDPLLLLSGLPPSSHWPNPGEKSEDWELLYAIPLGSEMGARTGCRSWESGFREANGRYPAQIHCQQTPGEGRFYRPSACMEKDWHTLTTLQLTTQGSI